MQLWCLFSAVPANLMLVQASTVRADDTLSHDDSRRCAEDICPAEPIADKLFMIQNRLLSRQSFQQAKDVEAYTADSKRPQTSTSPDNGRLDGEEICLPLVSPQVELVVSAWVENLDWLQILDMPTVVYVHNRTTGKSHCYNTTCPESAPLKSWQIREAEESQETLTRQKRAHGISFVSIPNQGDEAAAYLRHILMRYDDLDKPGAPKALAFVQGALTSWHVRGSILSALMNACLPVAEGYLTLNSGPDFDRNSPCLDLSEPHHLEQTMFFSRHWKEVFEPVLGPYPDKVCIDCCAQFAVSSSTLLRHPKAFYQKLLDINQGFGTSMEHEWRMLFVPRKMRGSRKLA